MNMASPLRLILVELLYNVIVMFQICKYNPVTDLTPVAQCGYINLVECFMNGTIPSTFDDDDASYNGIDNPAEVGAIVTDVFEAIRAAKAMEHAAKVAGVVAPSGSQEPKTE